MKNKSIIQKINVQLNIFIIIITLTTLDMVNLSNSNNKQEESIIDLNDKFVNINRKNKASFITQSLDVDKNITAKALFSENIEVVNSVKVEEMSTSKSTIASAVLSEKIITDTIRSFDGELQILGNIILVNEIEAETLNLSSNNNSNSLSFSISGVKQWLLTHHEDFEDEKSIKTWSDQRTSSCNTKYESNNNEINKKVKQNNLFLGGHCNFSHNEVSKLFKIPSKHSKIRIVAKFHFIDDWNGEYGYMKLNGKVIWTKNSAHNANNKYKNILEDKITGHDFLNKSSCGNDVHYDNLSESIDIIVSNSDEEINLSFGSTIKNDPCQQSFGVDDIIVYVK